MDYKNTSLQELLDTAPKETLREAVMWLGSFVGSIKGAPRVPWALSVFSAWSMVMTFHILEGRLTALEAAAEEGKAASLPGGDLETAKELLEIMNRYDLQRKVELGVPGDVN